MPTGLGKSDYLKEVVGAGHFLWLNGGMRKFILLTIAIILIARFYLGITRYLDVDEFAHLHWTYLITHGYLPYKDFFLYHIPLFQFALAPLFFLPPSWTIIVLSRIVLWILFIANLYLLYRITLLFTKNKIAGLMAVLIMAVFPMTFDKSIEVRPDLLMTFFFLTSIVLTKNRVFAAGFFYSLAILTFPKILFAAPALVFLLLRSTKKFIPFVVGLLLPITLFIFYLFANNMFIRGIDAIFHDSVAVSRSIGPFSLWLALSPYPLVYVTQGGISFPWIINTAVWISAIGGLVILWKNNRNHAIFFTLFFAGAILFLYIFPAPYLQYFLPLSYFASMLAAMMLVRFRLSGVIIVLLLFSFWQQWQLRVVPGADNGEQKQVVETILKISKPNDTVYDMVGSYVFRPDGYYICCHPYAEFVDQLSVRVPTLRDSLIAHHTKFIILDRTGQSLWKPKPEDLRFLQTNYVQSKYPKIYILITENIH